MTTTEILLLITALVLPWSNCEDTGKVRFPAEHERHERTLMIFPGTKMWNNKNKNMSLLESVQREIVSIAEAIVKFEPVTLIVSPNDYENVSKMTSSKIDLLKLETDDLWARNTIPLFTTQTAYDTDRRGRNVSKSIPVGVDFKKGKGDPALAQRLLWTLNIRRRTGEIVAEGGSLETDGAGTLLVKESSLKNDNLNMDKTEIGVELKRVLGVTKVIWFKGAQDSTGTHVHAIVRFVRPGRVMVSLPCERCKGKDDDVRLKASNEAIKVLNNTENVGKFEIVKMYEPNPNKTKLVGNKDNFVSSYVNFYMANGVVIMPKFGDTEADDAAQKIMREEFPGRKIVALEINAIVSGGGGIHCATHQMPSGSDRMSTGIRFLFVSLSTALFPLFKFRF